MNLSLVLRRSLLLISLTSIGSLSTRLASAQASIFPQWQRYDAQTALNSPVVGDFNGDHLPDVAFLTVASPSGQPQPVSISVLLNLGSGVYSSPIQTTTSCNSTNALVAADMNKDGNLDLVSNCTSSGFILVYRGDGTGRFAAPLSTGLANPDKLAVTDLNNDGYPDIVAIDRTTTAPGIEVLLNRGSIMPGSLANPVNTLTPDIPIQLATGDFNGDGKQDVVAEVQKQLSILYGNGDGSLKAPQSTQAQGAFTVADLNRDGISDIALVTAPTSAPAALQILLGDSSGQFIFKTPLPLLQSSSSIVAGAFRNRDLTDLAIGSGSTLIALNDGAGNFTLGNSYATGGTMTPEIEADGSVDLIFFQSSMIMLLVSNRDGTFRGSPILPNASGFADTDLNGDGIADIVFEDAAFSLNSALGRGDGTFLRPAKITVPQGGFNLEDFNRDGQPDLLVTTLSHGIGHGFETAQNAELVFCPGDRTGGFQTCSQPLDLQVVGISGTAVGDFNGDSNLDLVYSFLDLYSLRSGIYFLAGKGDGAFGSPTPLVNLNSIDPLPLLMADFNNDHKLDFIAPGRVYLGNGDGTFQALPYNLSSFPLAVKDLDGDRIADLLVGTGLYRGIGDGTFQSSPFFTLPVPVGLSLSSAATGDVNGDGNLDIVIQAGNSASGSDAFVFLGDGAGNYSLENTYYLGDTAFFGSAALARLNRNAPPLPEDGRKDLLVQVASGVTSLLNQLNPVPPAQASVSVSVTPTTLNVGQTVNATVHVTGRNPTGTVKLVMGSTTLGIAELTDGQASIPISFSTPGSFSFTAQYSGDSQNILAASDPLAVTVIAPDYSLTSNPTSATIKAGQSATFMISMATVGGYSGTVKLACSGLASETTCSFSPSTLGPGGATSTLTITTAAPKLARLSPPASSRRPAIVWAALLGLSLLPAGVFRSRGRLLRSSMLFSFALLVALQLAACSSSGSPAAPPSSGGSGNNPGSVADPGTPAGTQTISISASDASGTPGHSLNISLTVQ